MNKLKIFILFFVSFQFVIDTNAQLSKFKQEVSAFAMPMFAGRIMTVEGIPETYLGSKKDYGDSLQSADQMKLALGFGVGISFYKDDFSRFELGIRFSDQGFTRVRKGLGFGDLIHPEVGVVKDLSSTGDSKDIHYVYRYQYMQIPILYHFAPYKVKKFSEIDFYFTTGVSINLLTKHTVRVKLQGWSAYGKDVHDVDEHEYNPRPWSANVHFGFRFHYKMDENISWLMAPAASFSVLHANDGNEKVRLYDFSMPIGLIYTIKGK